MARYARLMLVVLLLAATAWPLAAQIGGRPSPRLDPQPEPPILGPAVLSQLKLLNIQNLPLTERPKLLNEKIQLEGFYYDGSVPMVIDDIDLTRMDKPLPTDAYILLTSGLGNVKTGDKIRVQGTLTRIGNNPIQLKPEGIPQVVQPSTSNLALVKNVTIDPKILELIRSGLLLSPQKYAVLIVGGYDPANNHMRYWNDLKTMYSILRANGYPAGNIYVIYANGVAKDASTPVNYSATIANVNTVFNNLASKMKMNDTLYVMLNDHGSQGGDANGDEADHIDELLCLWGQNMTDDEFAAAVNKITNYKQMIFQMKQCFCGGFVKELTGPRRIIMASSREPEVSWGHTSGNYGEFTYHYFGALLGHKPGSSVAVNADANGDGKVSIVEAYNYARSHDGAPEHPNYEDNNAAPSHEGPMPAGGDGTDGLACFL